MGNYLEVKMNKTIYDDILDHIWNGEKVCMVTNLTGRVGKMETGLRKELVFDSNSDSMIQESLIHGIPQCTNQGGDYTIAEPFYPEERLIVFGGGHIAIPLVEFAAKTGFLVTVVDDRLSFANSQRFPLARNVICDNFDHAISELKIKESDYIVIITRGHRYDSACLKSICQGKEPKYVGMIGSKRRTSIVIETLKEEGCDHQRLDRVHTPIGLAIGAITPEEIAISILSELISHKRLSGMNRTKKNCSDMDYEVLQVLAEEKEVPKAIITVVDAKGSVPRGAGAKMLVYQDGRILGSIGGGCSEGAVIGQARQMIGSNTYQVVEIDLTGDAAEDEGMVCGGIMTVLIEDFVVVRSERYGE